MQATKSKNVLIITEPKSKYFEQAVLVLKENVVKEEDALLNEARFVVSRYVKKLETGRKMFRTPSYVKKGKWVTLTVGLAVGFCLSFVLEKIF